MWRADAPMPAARAVIVEDTIVSSPRALRREANDATSAVLQRARSERSTDRGNRAKRSVPESLTSLELGFAGSRPDFVGVGGRVVTAMKPTTKQAPERVCTVHQGWTCCPPLVHAGHGKSQVG